MRERARSSRQTERARPRGAACEGINDFDFKRVGGGLLVQTPDSRNVAAAELRRSRS